MVPVMPLRNITPVHEPSRGHLINPTRLAALIP